MKNATLAKIGFGTYRVDFRVENHYKALRSALLGGIELIDTSSNYTDGSSEILVGNVINDLVNEGKTFREDLIIATKGGYIQGQNYLYALKKKNAGKPFSEVSECSEGLWHCISPDFLEDQIHRQLERLYPGKGERYIDIYLLHNPEYFLGWALKSSSEVDEEKIYEEYYARIKKAFEFLEEKVSKKIIRAYGISSNTFPSPSNKPDFTSLEKIIDISTDISTDNNFKCIQFPLNLIESGAVFKKNQKNNSKTVLDIAKKNNLGVLVNRPLNAFTNNGLIRLSKYEYINVNEEEIYNQLEKALVLENELKTEIESSKDNTHKQSGTNLIIISQLKKNREKFYSIEHFNDVIEHSFMPKINLLAEKLSNYEKFGKYIEEVFKSINLVSSYYKKFANERTKQLEDIIDTYTDSKFRELPLSVKAISIVRAVEGVNYVLVGARKEKYVNEILEQTEVTETKLNPEKILQEIKDNLESIKPVDI